MNKSKKGLTVKQKEIMEFIDAYQKEHNVIPTLVEMASKFGVTIPAIQHRIGSLVRRKVLVRENIYKISEFPKPCVPIAKVESIKQSDEGQGIPLL